MNIINLHKNHDRKKSCDDALEEYKGKFTSLVIIGSDGDIIHYHVEGMGNAELIYRLEALKFRVLESEEE